MAAASNPARDTDAWDRYWAYGSLHSFSQVSAGNYGGRIAAFWRTLFAGLADGSRVLDIATGNGAVPLLALEAGESGGRQLIVHGTDLAAIDPAHHVRDQDQRRRLAAITFHPGTAAEALPFGDAAFDVVCSQYGLEYSDLDRAIPQAARVLRPGGTLALIMHHHASAAVLAARQEITQVDFVLDEAGVYVKARNLLRAQAKSRGSRRGSLPPKVAKKRRSVEQAIARIEAAAQNAVNPRLLLGPLNYVREVLAMNERIGPEQSLQWLDEAERRVRATRRRLADMQAAARSEEDMAALAGNLVMAGFAEPEIATLVEDEGEIAGWRVRTQR